jgi:small multidrug resistance family-3 protein
MIKTFLLFIATALFETLGCYGILLYSKASYSIKSTLCLFMSISSLLVFALLLTYHPTNSGRIYATYGGVYVFVSLLWMWFVDKITPTPIDFIGIGLVLLGTWIIAKQYTFINNQ